MLDIPITATPTQAARPTTRSQILARLFAPVDIASLVCFRIAFGVLMLVEVWRFFDNDWISKYFIEPTFYFSYYGFDWVRPWPGIGMYLHFITLAVLAIFIAVGFQYRVSMALFFLGFTYVFLLDQSRWLNHFYLIALISFLMIFVPAHRAFSVDSRLRPSIRSDTSPAWTLWLLRAQLAIVYFYGGIAKLNGDWLHGEPMRTWLAQNVDFPVIGRLFAEPWAAYIFSYGGLLFDLLFVPFVLWRRTRPLALAVAAIFHLMNAQLFSIGIFPWFMLAANLLFLDPGWPRALFRRARIATPTTPEKLLPRQRLISALIGIYLAVQLLFPLRHHLYPGDVAWTGEGARFAWRMKLLDIQGSVQFFVTDPETVEVWEEDPFDYVTDHQYREMVNSPDMTLQLAHHIADTLRQEGYPKVEVRAYVIVSLNGREPQLLIDPIVDLAAQPRNLLPATWILAAPGPLVE